MKYWERLQLTRNQAVYGLIIVHIFISLYWLSQAGFFLIKDSAVYLAIADRTAEVPFFESPYDEIRSTNFILTNGPFYAYLINALQKLPGGFAPYHFLLTQLLHLAFVLSIFFMTKLWRSVRIAFLVTLLVMFEPFHYMDILVIKPSIFTQPTIGISMCLVAYGWKRQNYRILVWAALILGIGTIFRPFNLIFVPLLFLPIFLTRRMVRQKLIWAAPVLLITLLSLMPRTMFNSSNPEISVNGFDMYFLFVSNRLEQSGKFNSEYIPNTMEYYYELTPRLRDEALVSQYEGSSLNFYEAFRHERVYRYGDTAAEAEALYYAGGKMALFENPMAYLEATVKTFFRHWGITMPPLTGFNYQLSLWSINSADEPFFTLPPYGNTLTRMFACSAPFETCLSEPEPDLMPDDLVASLQNMPRPHIISRYIGETWERLTPFKGVMALLLTVSALFWLLIRQEWEVLLFGGSIIAAYLFILTFLVLSTTMDIVLILPWVAWITGMAGSSLAFAALRFSQKFGEIRRETDTLEAA